MNVFRLVVRRPDGTPNMEPYFTRGHWAKERSAHWEWALDLAEKAYPGQSYRIAYMDGPIVGGVVTP